MSRRRRVVAEKTMKLTIRKNSEDTINPSKNNRDAALERQLCGSGVIFCECSITKRTFPLKNFPNRNILSKRPGFEFRHHNYFNIICRKMTELDYANWMRKWRNLIIIFVLKLFLREIVINF
jgi:hypothetical protein